LLTAVPYCTKQFRLEQNFIHRRNCIWQTTDISYLNGIILLCSIS
jgi:hypothetical protein